LHARILVLVQVQVQEVGLQVPGLQASALEFFISCASACRDHHPNERGRP